MKVKNYQTSNKIKKDIDKILEENNSQRCKLGKDSTKSEVAAVKKFIKDNAKRIKEIDLEFWEMTFGVEV